MAAGSPWNYRRIPMSLTRRAVLVVLAAAVGLIIYHSVTSWGWTGQLQTPVGVPPQSVSYTCGALWGSAYVHGPRQTSYPLQGTPCGERGSYQVMTAIDVLLGVFAFTMVAGWRRVRRPAASTASP